MRRPRNFDAELDLKALEEKAKELKARKVLGLGELVIATGADSLSVDDLAGALIVLVETTEAGKRAAWAKRGEARFRSKSRRTAAANDDDAGSAQAARNRHQATRARHDMRSWQVECRKRMRPVQYWPATVIRPTSKKQPLTLF